MSIKQATAKRILQRSGSFCGVVANVLNCDIVVSEFEHQSRHYVHL